MCSERLKVEKKSCVAPRFDLTAAGKLKENEREEEIRVLCEEKVQKQAVGI